MSPLPINPLIPSLSIIDFKAWGYLWIVMNGIIIKIYKKYVTASWLVYLVVLSTLNELDMLSDTTDAVKPMKACLNNFLCYSL